MYLYLFFRHHSALLTKFFAEALFRTSALECLTEIAGLVDLDPRYNPLQQQMFVVLVKQVTIACVRMQVSNSHCAQE